MQGKYIKRLAFNLWKFTWMLRWKFVKSGTPGVFIKRLVEAKLKVNFIQKIFHLKKINNSLTDFTGIDSPYEPPQRPEMTLPTNEMSVSECTQQLVDMLVTRVYHYLSLIDS